MRVVGVDGCPGGWIAVAWDTEEGMLRPRFHEQFDALFVEHAPAVCIAVDIPIGLTADAPRACDILARRCIGPRHSSVFPAPCRELFNMPDYATAVRVARATTGKGISRQAHAILPKIEQVDRLLAQDSALQGRIVEVHPEVSFWAMNACTPLTHSKKAKNGTGFAERRELLCRSMPVSGIPTTQAAARGAAHGAGADDYLDAIAAAWTAWRVATGQAGRLPDEPAYDATGLRMEIVY